MNRLLIGISLAVAIILAAISAVFRWPADYSAKPSGGITIYTRASDYYCPDLCVTFPPAGEHGWPFPYLSVDRDLRDLTGNGLETRGTDVTTYYINPLWASLELCLIGLVVYAGLRFIADRSASISRVK
jgi:hypothetical protein